MKTNAAFWDTSALIPLCCQQVGSQDLRQLWRQTGRVVVWWAAVIEARSAFARLHKGNHLSSVQVQQAINRLETMRLQWHEIMPIDKVRSIAETLPDTYGLKALDTFQLAAALVWCGEKPKGRRFVCLDKELREVAQKAGFVVNP